MTNENCKPMIFATDVDAYEWAEANDYKVTEIEITSYGCKAIVEKESK